MTNQNHPAASPLSTSAAAAHHLVDAELSTASRFGYLTLLLTSLAMSVVTGALWLTEPALPARASIALVLMTAIGASWVAFAIWVLTRRRVLFARHSIVAGRMAVTFTSIFVAGALAIGLTNSGTAPFVAAACGLLMLAAALVILRRAHRAFDRLESRRRELEAGLAGARR
jgi:hypothetical protein